MSKNHLQRVVWREGMLIAPQHLQQQDLFHESTLAARLSALTPLHWGVYAMTVDVAALQGGQFRLTSFKGVLPDGLPVEFSPGEQDASPPARPIADHFPATASSLDVYLAVAATREGIANYSENESLAHIRYRMNNRSVADLTVAKSQLGISFARPNVILLLGSESRNDFVSLKIAEIIRDGSGAFVLSPTYIPPSMAVGASPFILEELKELLSQALVKQRALADNRRQRDQARADFSNRDITNYLLLSVLNTHIPILRHIADATSTSSLAAYLELVQLAGQLTSFSMQIDPSSFPAFIYTDLRSTFEPLFREIKIMLGVVVREVCIPVPLEARRDGSWIGRLADDRLLKCPTFVLIAEGDVTEQELANKLPELGKIASWKQIAQIVKTAIPGAPLTATHRPPAEVPIRPKQVYFTIDTEDRYWRTILSERTVAIYFPAPFDSSRVKISLLGVPDSKSS